MSTRKVTVSRQTKETKIRLLLDLDGQGQAQIATGVGFLDHMLTHLARHSGWDLEIQAEGDLHVDAHHTVEDVGICLGSALREALGEKRGIRRFADCAVPMDETLAQAAVDISGRAHLVCNLPFPTSKIGEFDVELVAEFLRAVVNQAAVTVHVNVPYGGNSHHIAEAAFKALARALGEACRIDPRITDVPSTKGTL